MLRTEDKRMRIGERLPYAFGQRDVRYFITRIPRLSGPTTPPVAGYVAHYDPSDLTTLTFTGSEMVSSVADKSGNGNTLANGVCALGYEIRSGRCVLVPTYTAAADALRCSTVDRSDLSSSTFCVAMPTIFPSANLCMIGASGSGGNEFRITSASGKLETLRQGVASKGTQDNATCSVGVPFVGGQVIDASGVTHYNNLVSETDADASSFTAARSLYVGWGNGLTGGEVFRGWIGEMVFYDTTLSAGDSAAVVQYLMSKWSIA